MRVNLDIFRAYYSYGYNLLSAQTENRNIALNVSFAKKKKRESRIVATFRKNDLSLPS